MVNIHAIAACDQNGVLGKDGKLAWHYKDELKHFSETISNAILVMGYKTFQSLPKKFHRDRKLIVFSKKNHSNLQKPYIFIASTLDEFRLLLKTISKEHSIFIIGGAEIFNLLLKHDFIESFYLTKIKKAYIGDTYFSFKHLLKWSVITLKDTQDFTVFHYFRPQS